MSRLDRRKTLYTLLDVCLTVGVLQNVMVVVGGGWLGESPAQACFTDGEKAVAPSIHASGGSESIHWILRGELALWVLLALLRRPPERVVCAGPGELGCRGHPQ